MFKTFSVYRYRIYPTKEQEMRLKRSLLVLCDLYNELRARKIEDYRANDKSLTRTDLRALALQIRRESDELKQVHSQVVQNAADRVHTGFQNYFNGRARFPKPKKYKDYRSFTYPQFGFRLDGEVARKGKTGTEVKGRLHLACIGEVRIFLHRPLEESIERLSIKYEAGEWYACFLVERPQPEKPSIASIRDTGVRGGDLGLEAFIVFDNTDLEEYPEFLRLSEEKVKRLQRSIAHKEKGSRRRRELQRRLANLHLHIVRQREDWQNKIVATTFKDTEVLVLEKLPVENMRRNHSLAKSISDAAWSKFARKALYKSEMLGKRALFIDPWGTTQFCHNCLEWVPKGLEKRDHKCPRCGEATPRDLNSAKLIKKVLVHYLKLDTPSDGGSSLAELKPLPSLRGMVSSGEEARSPRPKS